MTSVVNMNGEKLFDLSHQVDRTAAGVTIDTNVLGDNTDFDVNMLYADEEKRITASGLSNYFGQFKLEREVSIEKTGDGHIVRAVSNMETERGFLVNYGLNPYYQTFNTVYKTGSYDMEGQWIASISGTNIQIGLKDGKLSLQ